MNISEADPSRLKLCHTSWVHLAQKGSLRGDEGFSMMREAQSSFFLTGLLRPLDAYEKFSFPGFAESDFLGMGPGTLDI